MNLFIDRICLLIVKRESQHSWTGTTSGAGTAYPPFFSGVRVTQSSVICVIFCKSLFVLCPFFWP
jgi:hypothetical protein